MKPDKSHPAWLHKAMADGGRTWQGEGDTGQKLRDNADRYWADFKKDANDTAKDLVTAGVGSTVGSLGKELGSRAARAFGAAGKYGGLGIGAVDALHGLQSAANATDAKKLSEQAEGRAKGGKVNKGPLSAKRRNALPKKSFAGPDRSYPINDPNHARNALARVANKSPAMKARVRAAVHRKYPGIGKD